MNQVVTVLQKFSIDTASVFEKGLCLHRIDIPVRDNTATTAAAIQKQSLHRNLHRSDDEWVTMARAMSNGTGGGGMEIGAQQLLQVYNGPSVLINELKSGAEIMRMPRLVLIGNIQPPLFESESGLFDVSVRCGMGNNLIVIHRNMLNFQSESAKMAAVSVLNRLNISLDEFISNSCSGDFDIDIRSLPPIVPGTLPYGLKPFAQGENFASQQAPFVDRFHWRNHKDTRASKRQHKIVLWQNHSFPSTMKMPCPPKNKRQK